MKDCWLDFFNLGLAPVALGLIQGRIPSILFPEMHRPSQILEKCLMASQKTKKQLCQKALFIVLSRTPHLYIGSLKYRNWFPIC
ncbi:hypothetical protein F0562_031106 [Nyssa sinensis]|uniref:Uncharacterized protein n=1 Tax=Nyssa sinensis TaxID=561372 RepID=A0A5J5ASA0_9ASTE|nr:hypothetical protein F0562_031106 [Nyssa sinensis]